MDIFVFWLVLYIIGNFLLAIPVAYVAASKGRSAGGFLLLSFFFTFIVGILVVLALPKVETQMIVGNSGSFARRDADTLFKCPNCAEWVKSEAKVCRFCGKDIAKDVQVLLEREKKVADKEQREYEERARASLQEQERIQEEKRQKLSRTLKNPLVIVFSSILGAVVLSAITLFFLNGNAERQALIDSKSDWASLAKSCEGSLYVDGGDTYEVRDSGKEIVVNAYNVAGNPFLDCIGQKIAIDAPADRKLGLHITYAGDTWSGGGLGTMTTEYGNLRISANRLDQNSYVITIR